MNAGCYGTYTADVFVSARAVTRQGRVVTLAPADMGFAYRATALPEGMVIDRGRARRAARRARGAGGADGGGSSPAATPRQPTKERSAGSTFRNPAGFSSTGRADDVHDLKAWKLIERAGMRGATLGGAQMSPMHANFLINTGGRTPPIWRTSANWCEKRFWNQPE